MVLLKNDGGALPLQGTPRIAVVGPNADTVETLEANYHATPRMPVTPLQGLRARFGADHVSYARGAPVAAGVPVPIPETALRTSTAADAAAGLTGHYFDNVTFDGAPRTTRVDRSVDFDWDHVTPGGLPKGRYAVRWTGAIVPQDLATTRWPSTSSAASIARAMTPCGSSSTASR